jgi:hypothetical protein
MKIKIGKYYQGTQTGVVVKALCHPIQGCFKGVVIEQNTSDSPVGEISDDWAVDRFVELRDYSESSSDLFPIY